MAELVSIKRNVDVSPGQAAPAVFHCSQGDVGSKIILGLLNNGTAYAIPSGVTVTIEGSESNGSIFTPISATASGSDITFYLTGEMTAVAGPAICQAVLKSGSNILGTANFTLEVESSPMGADAPPVFTDAGWTWMLNKLTTEFVPALGDNIIDAIESKADQSNLTALSNTVTGHTGSITVLNNTVNTLNHDVRENRQNIATKLDKNQGTTNAGKYLKVGADGNVETAGLDVTTDKTLSIADKAADAKAVGDELDDLKADLTNINSEIYSSSESVYNWSNDAATGFPYNFRPGYINTTTGAIGSNSSTIKKYVRNNKAVSFGAAETVTITPPTGYYLMSVTEYSSATISAENFVRNLRYSTNAGESFTFANAQGKFYAIVVGEFTNSNDYYNQPLMQSIIAKQLFETSRLDELTEISKDVRGITVSKTNQSADYSTIKAAVEYAQLHPNTTIFVDSGDYDIIEELGGSTYTENLSGLSSYAGGLSLGNGTRIIGVGSGVKFAANYTAGTNQVMTDRFSIFNIVGSFHLENIEMEVTNVRYCVHEDMSALSAVDRLPFYVGEYKNCKMRHNGTVSQTFNPTACIGGGTMNKSLHIIDGCYLESPTGKNPAGYHNNVTSNDGTARVILRNSYLANNGTFTLTVYNSNTQVIDAEICGNRLGKSIVDNSSGLYNVKAWNNEIAV